MNLRRISALALLMLSLGTTAALADTKLPPLPLPQNQGGPGGMMHPGGMRRPDRDRGNLIQQLNLTSDQQKQLDAIHQKSEERMEQPRQALRSAEQKLQDLMVGTATEDQIRNQYKQVQQLRQQMADASLDNLLASRKVLTLEQRQKFAQLMEQRRAQFQNRVGNPPKAPKP